LIQDGKFSCYFKKKEEFGEVHYSVVGFATVFKFFAYPDKIRKRISQVLILSPFQKAGHGARLLREIYNYSRVSQVRDITVEDPSFDFSRLRDIVDVSYLLESSSFFKEKPLKPLDKRSIEAIRDETKLTPEQIKHCYNILHFREVNIRDATEYKQFRLQVKRKLFKKYEDVLSAFDDNKVQKKRRVGKDLQRT